jgi:CHAT domain-containing protein
MMNYLPFQALLHDVVYLIEEYEISYSPSLAVLYHCLGSPNGNVDRSLFIGVPDASTPMVEHEISELAQLFPESTCLIGPEATLENLQRSVSGRGLIHIACHGKFRRDNPAFSSLALFSEVLSVNKIYGLDLENSIITLSACESGVNEVRRGEELIGMTRAFLAAGASTLLMTLWRVDDSATSLLMKDLYMGFRGGAGFAGSLREAQISFIRREIHPYFWSPFVVSGKW